MNLQYSLPEKAQEIVNNLRLIMDTYHDKCFNGFEHTPEDYRYSEHQTRQQHFLDATESISAQIVNIHVLFGRYSMIYDTTS